MSRQPRSNRGNRERNDDHRASSDRSSSRPPSYSREAHVRQVPRVEHRNSKWTHICSRRGIILICAVLTNSLVLICVVAAHMVTTGMSSATAMSGFNLNSVINFEGTELQQVRELDMQYSQMRAPSIYGGIPFSLTFGVISLLFVVAGNKPPHLMARKLLVGALAFQGVGAVAYVVAVGLYLHFVIMINSTDVCTLRERLYARNGYTWMNCAVSGGDAAVALFGLITAILYTAGFVVTIQTIRHVKRYLQDRKQREEERRKAQSQPHRAPLRAETTFV